MSDSPLTRAKRITNFISRECSNTFKKSQPEVTEIHTIYINEEEKHGEIINCKRIIHNIAAVVLDCKGAPHKVTRQCKFIFTQIWAVMQINIKSVNI